MGIRVLLVDDEPNIRAALRLCFDPADHVSEAATVEDALAQVQRLDFDVALVDLRLGDGDGLEVLRAAPRSTAVVIMTAFGTVETAVHAMRHGAVDYLQKPFDTSQVRQVVERALRQRSLHGELSELRAEAASTQRFEPSVSAAMRRVVKIADRAAATDATVLVRGESGTGKGVLARYLHDRSARAERPFLTVDLSSIASTLLESELFGHTRGAFTGAATAKTGRVESAAGGTLFLDEIGELPLALQSKLLRFAQDQQFERVGDTVTRQVDVRIVAATNRDLRAMVSAGTFREDLYYRLKVIELEIPPLRERVDDVLPLARAFLERSALKLRRSVRGVSEDAARVLVRYPWPGNVRELRNSIERAVILADGDIADADLFAAEAEAIALPPVDPDGDTLVAAERRHIASVLSRHANMEDAARALGVDSVTLWRRRKKYGLP